MRFATTIKAERFAVPMEWLNKFYHPSIVFVILFVVMDYSRFIIYT